MNIEQLTAEIRHISFTGDSSAEISGVTRDTREVQKGSVFVCIRGAHVDGHDLARQAAQAGAVLVIAERETNCGVAELLVEDTKQALAEAACAYYGHPSRTLKVIGVTGTNGKTTVSHLLKSILEMADKKVGLIGTDAVIIGDKEIPAERTTPEANELQEYFARMLQEGAEYCVMEVSSHALELKRVYGTKFVLGIFTNLTHDHLDFHKTMENYAAAKAKLFDDCEVGVGNADDAWNDTVTGKAKKRYLYSIENKSDLRASEIRLSQRGSVFRVAGGMEEEIKVGLPGRFNVYNALAAAAGALALGVAPEAIQRGLIISRGAKGRAEMVPVSAPYRVMIDFAHTPDGLENILSTVREFTQGRLITVFGSAGDRDSEKREPMGEIVGTRSDYCVITTDNPAHERAEDICDALEKGVKRSNCPYRVILDRKEAIFHALDTAREDDVVLLAGKGHETYQIIGDEKVPFSETEIVKAYFQKK